MKAITSCLLVASLHALACGGSSPAVECSSDLDCNLGAGGRCAPASSGNSWCSYPDTTCPAGWRWSDYGTGDGLSGECVEDSPPDAGIADAAVSDARNPDASLPDATPPPDGNPGALEWARAWGASEDDRVADLVLLADNSVVATGSFAGSVSFGGASLTSAGGADAFLVKLAPDGGHVWSLRWGSANLDRGAAVAADAAGNVYVAGAFVGTVDIDGQQLTAAGSMDGFLAKFDTTTGRRVWAIRLGGVNQEFVEDVAVAGDGVAVVGTFATSTNVGGSEIMGRGVYDVFVAKYLDASGAHAWSRGFGGAGIDEGHTIAVAGSDVIVAGEFQQSVNFGGPQPLTSANNSTDVFVARYAGDNGAYAWAFRHGGTSADEAMDVTVADGALYMSGKFNPPASFGGAVFESEGFEDGFVAKYDAATGSHTWSKAFGGGAQAHGRKVVVAGGALWLAGTYTGTVSIGSSTFTCAKMDFVLARLAPTTGNVEDVTSYGGAGFDTSLGLGISADGMWLGGDFEQSLAIAGGTVSAAGSKDGFVTRLPR
jgi:hypothetical protein